MNGGMTASSKKQTTNTTARLLHCYVCNANSCIDTKTSVMQHVTSIKSSTPTGVKNWCKRLFSPYYSRIVPCKHIYFLWLLTFIDYVILDFHSHHWLFNWFLICVIPCDCFYLMYSSSICISGLIVLLHCCLILLLFVILFIVPHFSLLMWF